MPTDNRQLNNLNWGARSQVSRYVLPKTQTKNTYRASSLCQKTFLQKQKKPFMSCKFLHVEMQIMYL